MTDSHPVWINDGDHDLDIAKFVIEGDEFVEHIVARAVSELRGATRSRHQTFASAITEGSSEGLRAAAEAIYLRISDDCHLLYEFERAFDDTTKEQLIRLPSMISKHYRGTCIDLVILFLSCLANAKLRPIYIHLRGDVDHSLGANWLSEPPPRRNEFLTLADLRNGLEAGDLMVIECTGFVEGYPQRPYKISFAEARKEAQRLLEEIDGCSFGFALDVRGAWEKGIRPIREPRNLPMLYLHLPTPPKFFAGRVEELSQLGVAAKRNTPSIIMVVGMGGQGKTSLIYQWLQQQKDLQFAAGLWCAAHRDGFSFDMFLDEALSYLLQGKFNKHELPNVAARSAKLLNLLQLRPAIIVIDGIERWFRGWHRGIQDQQAAETDEGRVGHFEGLDDFLRQASGLCNGTHLILTTRAIPAALDDTDVAIVHASGDSNSDLALKGLDPTASVTLLRQLGVKGEDDQIKLVADSYAHHPLALTVLGGLLRKTYSGGIEHLTEITALTPKRGLFKLLDETRQNLPGGATAEQLMCIASHSLENPTLAAIAAAMPTPSVPLNDLLELAVTLADWNLIGWDGEFGIVQLHPLVKQYFSSLVDVSESAAIHERFSDWYAQQPIPDDASSLDHVHPRIVAIEHALRAGNLPRCRDLFFLPINKTYPFVEWLAAWGHQTTAIELLGRLAKASPPQTRVEFLIARAALQRQIGTLDGAHNDLDEAIRLVESDDAKLSHDQQANLTSALTNRGNVRWQLSRLAEAIEDYDRALKILDQLPDRDPNRDVHIACVLMNRGIALREIGRYGEAAADCSQALEMYGDLVTGGMWDLEPTLVSALINRGNVLADQLRHEDALRDFAEAICVCERLIQDGRREIVPFMAHAQVMRVATLNDAGHSEEAIREADGAISVLWRLIEEGRNDLEPLLALSWLGRSLACLRLQQWHTALDDCNHAIHLYNLLIQSGRSELTGWLAHALVNRSEAHYEIGDGEAAAADREEGFDLLQCLIAKGEIETRMAYLHKSISTAKYLLVKHPAEAMTLLDIVLNETERGFAEGHPVEALRIEAQQGIKELSSVESTLRKADPHNTAIQRLQACLDSG